jgi:hypothetical protein
MTFSGFSLGDSLPVFNEVDCRTTQTASETSVFIENKWINLRGDKKNCSANYSYSMSKGEAIVILVGPTNDELGINAQQGVYIANKFESFANEIGSIPVSANLTSDMQFTNIEQAGGSLFMTTYKVELNNLTVSPSGLELMFSDSQCIYKNQHSKNCEILKGTYRQPICIKLLENRKTLTKKENCANLIKEINPHP